jgi:hypothetical protein
VLCVGLCVYGGVGGGGGGVQGWGMRMRYAGVGRLGHGCPYTACLPFFFADQWSLAPPPSSTPSLRWQDREKGTSKGCGFVVFSQRESANNAILALNGKFEMTGARAPMIVQYADTPAQKEERRLKKSGMAAPGMGAMGAMGGMVRCPPAQGVVLCSRVRVFPVGLCRCSPWGQLALCCGGMLKWG